MKAYRSLYLSAMFFCFLFLLTSFVNMSFAQDENAGEIDAQFELKKFADTDIERSVSAFSSFSKKHKAAYDAADAVKEAIKEVEKNRAVDLHTKNLVKPNV